MKTLFRFFGRFINQNGPELWFMTLFYIIAAILISLLGCLSFGPQALFYSALPLLLVSLFFLLREDLHDISLNITSAILMLLYSPYSRLGIGIWFAIALLFIGYQCLRVHRLPQGWRTGVCWKQEA